MKDCNVELCEIYRSIKNLWTELNSKESSLGNPSTDGYILSSTASGNRSWIPSTSGKWIDDTNGIHYNGNIGIGVDSLDNTELVIVRAQGSVGDTNQLIDITSSEKTRVIIRSGNAGASAEDNFSEIYLGESHSNGKNSYGIIRGSGIAGQITHASSISLLGKTMTGTYNSIFKANIYRDTEAYVGIGINFSPNPNGAILQVDGNASGTLAPTKDEHFTRKDYVDTILKTANINNHSVSYSGNLGTTLSRIELDNLIPSPIQGELYGIQDNNNHSFLIIYDGTDFWYERFTKAN